MGGLEPLILVPVQYIFLSRKCGLVVYIAQFYTSRNSYAVPNENVKLKNNKLKSLF